MLDDAQQGFILGKSIAMAANAFATMARTWILHCLRTSGMSGGLLRFFQGLLRPGTLFLSWKQISDTPIHMREGFRGGWWLALEIGQKCSHTIASDMLRRYVLSSLPTTLFLAYQSASVPDAIPTKK
eukprot:3729876-Amphidinium_carterae.1